VNLAQEIEAYEFEVNDWGSCQYAGALATYQAVMRAYHNLCRRRGGSASPVTGIVSIINFDLGASVVIEGRTPEEGLARMKYELETYFEELQQDLEGSFHTETEMVQEEKRVAKVNQGLAAALENLLEVFAFLRNSSWDLWGAAPQVAWQCGIKIESAPKARGIGPVFNILAQSENVLTGLCCAMLVILGFIPEDKADDAFGGFDT
jgi:hypothetical protein